MRFSELVTKIHKSIEDADLVTARKLIESNMDSLNQQRNLLKGNARELLAFLTDRAASGNEDLTRSEMATTLSINSFATKFDLISIKATIRGREQLLLKKDFSNHLNSDARVILEGMGAIEPKISN